MTPTPPSPRRHAPDADPRGALLALTRLSHSLLQQLSLGDLLWHVAEQVGELFGFEDLVVYLAEPQGLVQCAAFGVKSPRMRRIHNPIVLQPGTGIVGSVAASGRSERIQDTRVDPRYVADEFAGRSELAVPIVYGGRVLGVLDSESSVPGGYSATDQATLELVAAMVAPALASARASRDVLRAEAALQRVEQEQRERQRRLHTERMESLGQLAGGIAHDFNNLLTAIFGNVALASQLVVEPEAQELLAAASAACERSRSLTKQLLTFASGGAPVREVADLGAWLRPAVTTAVGGTGLRLQLDLPDEPVLVACDQLQLDQVVRHLVRNAAEAQPEGGWLQVRLCSGESAPRFAELRFHDGGPGIEPAHRGRIFDPYFTTRPTRNGLGLSTSFWIARRHGGSLELVPDAAPGACFLLRLPMATPIVAEAPPLPQRSLRVLVMDDDPAVRQMLVRMLQGLGHAAVGVGDGIACVREFVAARQAGRPYDIALLDLTLPTAMSGNDTLVALHEVQPSLPAVVISGYHDSATMAEPASAGFRGRLEKPFTAAALQQALLQAVR